MSRHFDPKEFDLPETHYVRDIENRVFQGIVVQVLAQIEGIAPIGGSLIDNFFGRHNQDGLRGIHIEQEMKSQCVSARVEVNIQFGLSIPDKANEIQTKVAQELTRLTGLHVSSVHVIFKGILPSGPCKKTVPCKELVTEIYETHES